MIDRLVMEETRGSESPAWVMPAQRNGAHPFRLPGEIVILITDCLDPSDILSMRKTCRSLNNITLSRIVWLRALLRVCMMHDISAASFPIDEMSNSELEHAATAPKRFLNLIKRPGPETTLLPFSSRDIILRQSPSLEGTHKPGRIFLLPGGRYLLVSTVNWTLTLWDLGYNVHAAPKPFPIATSERCGPVMGIQQSGHEVFVATVGKFHTNGPPETSELCLRIYAIDLASQPRTRFEVVAQLALESHQSYCIELMAGSIGVVILNYGSEFLVWNWRERKGCKWVTSLHLSVEDTTIYAFNWGLLTTCRNAKRIYTWEIPELSPVPQLSGVGQFPVVHNEPKATTPWVDGAATGVYIRCAGFPSGNTSICFFYEGQQAFASQLTVSPLRVNHMGHGNDFPSPQLPEAVLAPGGYIEHLYSGKQVHFCSAISAVFSCEDSLVFCAATLEQALIVTALPTPARGESGSLGFPITSKYLTPPKSIHHSSRFHSGKVGFCPVSGRVVFVKPDDSVCIMDFLRPPSEPESKGVTPA
ncbi:hypothetical protein NMY22_g16785 [Coprinellus aureogranulatus]|nr:hypothetical protein NMY22_g16785 [Coprinellus aureogranulatus]